MWHAQPGGQPKVPKSQSGVPKAGILTSLLRWGLIQAMRCLVVWDSKKGHMIWIHPPMPKYFSTRAGIPCGLAVPEHAGTRLGPCFHTTFNTADGGRLH